MTFNSHDSLKVNFQNILFINKKTEQVLYRHSPSMKNNDLDKSRGKGETPTVRTPENSGVWMEYTGVQVEYCGVWVEYRWSTDGVQVEYCGLWAKYERSTEKYGSSYSLVLHQYFNVLRSFLEVVGVSPLPPWDQYSLRVRISSLIMMIETKTNSLLWC